MPITLPTEKQAPTLTADTAKILLYGAPGIGKTTLAANIDPDSTLILACEPGTGGIEAYVQPITSWAELREAGAALAAGDHPFKTVVLDTTDEAFRMCQDHVLREHGIRHPSELDFGKGWSLLSDEWRLRIAKLAGLGLGVIFISHAKEIEVKQRVGSIKKSVPTLSGQAGKFLTGFVDYIFFAAYEGGERVLRTQPSEYWDAKSRLPVPDPLPLQAVAVREALQQIDKTKTTKTKKEQ